MKMLVDRIPLSTTLPVDPELVKLFNRSNVPDNADPEIEPLIRAATAELEQVAQIALLHQTIRVHVIEPEDGRFLRLPHRHALGPMRQDVPLRHRPRRDRFLLALTGNESGAYRDVALTFQKAAAFRRVKP